MNRQACSHWRGRTARAESLRHGLLATAMILGSCALAPAQQTNAPSRTDYSFFKMIVDRNIFDPNRNPHRAEKRGQRGPEVEAFSFVGTMSYDKGTFAFFDGTSSTYRKALQVNGTIAGYKVKEIEPNVVKLEGDGKEIEMPVKAQMRHETQGGWRLVAQSESPTEPTEEDVSEASSSSGTDAGSGGEVSDVLKKLMQQREQELK